MSKGLLFHGFLAITQLFISFPSFSQERISVFGRVLDAVNGLPIRNANVFFNNTSLTAETDSLGVFRIDHVPLGLREIVASSVGYITQSHNLNSPDKRPIVIFKMVRDTPPDLVRAPDPGAYKIPVSDEKKWSELYVRFKRAFLGQGNSAQDTEILNPSVLHFESSNSEIDLFFASTDHPLEIINHTLGYKLLVSLVEFKASRNSHAMLFRTQFDTLPAKTSLEKIHWQLNRLNIYQGSPRHFFKSVREGRLVEEGFSVYQGELVVDVRSKQYNYLLGNKPTARSLIYADTTKSRFKVFKRGLYQINYSHSYVQKKNRYFNDYPFPVSWLDVRDTCINLGPHGDPILPADFTFSGHMNGYRIPEMLPYDFDPNQTKSDLQRSGQLKSFTVRGIVKDEKGVPLSEVEVFVHGGLNQTMTNDAGEFEIHNLHPGLYPLGFAHPEMELALRNINISESEPAGLSIQLKEQKSATIPFDEFNQRREFDWLNLMYAFESKLCRQGYNSKITNPYVLIVKPSEKKINIQTLSPLIIEDKNLGYRWTYFLDSASLVKVNGSYKLNASGIIKMDTLSSNSVRENYKWQSNRFIEYIGSWNHFSHTLIAGKTEEAGFKTYQVINQSISKPLEWTKLTKNDYVAITPDSILRMESGRFYLQIPAGFEIHYEAKKDVLKMYSDYAHRVMRIAAGSPQIPITLDGIVAPGSCNRQETQMDFLPRVPVDFYPESLFGTDRVIKPRVKKGNQR